MTSLKTPAGGARTNTPNMSWKRVEIYWSDSIENDWSTDKYYCPSYKEIEKVGALKKAVFTPNLQQGVANNTSLPGQNVPSQASDESNVATQKVIQEAKEILKHGKADGIICSEVSQWVIIEVETYKPIIDGDYTTFPNLHIWSFLQPIEIGNTKSMKDNMGFVVDDIPRAGWFEAHLCWNWLIKSEYDIKTDSMVPRYAPRFSRLQPDPQGKPEHVDVIQCSSSAPNEVHSKIRYKLITESGKQACYKIQIKIKLTIRNEETSQDRIRKNSKLYEECRTKLEKELKKQGTPESDIAAEVEKKLGSIRRFEGGSYIKIWARNLDYTWAVSILTADVEDDETERNMLVMQELDCPTPKERDLYTFKNYNNTPDVEKGEKTFRPYSFRNHNWKRNKISISRYGLGSEDKAIETETVFIVLLPAKVIKQIGNLMKLPDKKAQIPDWLWPIAVIVIYSVMVTILRKSKDGLKEADPTKLKDKKKKLQTSFDALDLPKHFAQLASIKPPSDINQIKDLFKAAKFSDVFKGDAASAHGLDDTQRMCQFFYFLFNQFYALMLKSSDEDYKKFLKEREELANSFWNEKNSKSAKQKLKLFDANADIIKFSSTSAEKERKVPLAKGIPRNFPGVFCWAAWDLYFNMGYKIASELSFSLKESPQGLEWVVNGSFKPEGFMGLVVEIGTFLSMLDLKELGTKYKSAWQFEETLKSIIMWLDIKAGASLKLVLKGNLAGTLTHEQKFTQSATSNLTDVQKKSTLKPAATMDLSIDLDSTLFGYLTNFFTIEYGAMKFNLCTLTSNGMTLAGDGLWLFGNDVLKGNGLSWNWGKVALSEKASFSNPGVYCFGDTIGILTYARGTSDAKAFTGELVDIRGGTGEDNNSYAIVSDTNASKKIGDDASQSGFDKKIEISCKLDISVEEIENEKSFPHIFLSRLCKGERKVYGRVTASKIKSAETKNSDLAPYITIKQPVVTSYSFRNSNGTPINSKTKIQLDCRIDNINVLMPLYLWLYEVDTLGNDLCHYVTTPYYIIAPAIQKCVLNSITFKTVIELSKFNIKKQVSDFRIAGYGPKPEADLGVGISFDSKGKIRLPFALGNKITLLSPIESNVEVVY